MRPAVAINRARLAVYILPYAVAGAFLRENCGEGESAMNNTERLQEIERLDKLIAQLRCGMQTSLLWRLESQRAELLCLDCEEDA